MRIPSQLNRESLYRQKNQRQRSTEDYRRIIRLCLGLALVLLVMQQAAKPKVYQTFFDPSQGEEGKSDGNRSPEPNAKSPKNSTNRAEQRHYLLASASFSAEDREIARELTSSLLASDQQLWLRALLDWQAGKNAATVPSSVEILRDRLDQLAAENDASGPRKTISLWRSAIDTLPVEESMETEADHDAQKSSNQKLSPMHLVSRWNELDLKRFAFLQALDVQATSQVVDGSVWRSGDFDSLYSFLHQSNAAPRKNIPELGVLPLLQQPDIYRNQWVQIKGLVARVDRIETPYNPYEIASYWQIWLQPLDGVNRPLVAIVPTVPPVVEDLHNRQQPENNPPELSITGRYLKRLSYQSGIGADLAPVIVGEIRLAPADSTNISKTTTVGKTEDSSMLLAIMVAIGLGIGASLIVMHSTSKAAKRSRELRRSKQRLNVHKLATPDHFNTNLTQQERASTHD